MVNTLCLIRRLNFTFVLFSKNCFISFSISCDVSPTKRKQKTFVFEVGVLPESLF